MKHIPALTLCMVLGLLPMHSVHADSPPHPCGAIGWMDEIRILQADFTRERGQSATQALFQDTLAEFLPQVDARLSLDRSTWTVRWEDQPPIQVERPATNDLRDLYRAVTSPACQLLRQHDPEKASRHLSGSWRNLWIDFEQAFLARLGDPAAAFGFSALSLSIDSPSFNSAFETYSLQWMDRSLGIARLFTPALEDYLQEPLNDGLIALRTEAPLRTLILDLRGTGGGEIRTLESLLARFLPSGTLAYTLRNRQGQETEVRVTANTSPAADRQLRLIVLTSSKTRGGAELLAGALQANHRAMVFGEPTAGMAGYKRVIKLSDKNSLILTDSLPRFPGQTTLSPRITPTVLTPANDAFTAALATLAEKGHTPHNPFIRRDEHRFPLVQAILERKQEDAVQLIKSGAPLDVEASRSALNRLMPSHFSAQYSGETPVPGYPLAIAAAAQGLPKVLAAIGQRAPEQLKQTDTEGRTALAYAALGGFGESTRILLRYGLDPLHPAKQYPISRTPLALAVQAGYPDVVRQLMAAIPRERLGHTAVIESVWVASSKNDLPTLTSLLEGGASPNYIAPQGGTALISAVEFGQLDAVRLLLKYGGTVDDHLYRGYSVFQYAERNAAQQHRDAEEILTLIRQAPRQERDWKKSPSTENLEQLWKMIEGPHS